jgi:hypothetical protein
LGSDWNVSRFIKPWLETMEDVERFKFVHLPPSDRAVARARERFAAQKKVADEYGVVTMGGCGMGLTYALLLFGAENAVLLSVDHPDIIDRFLEIEHETTMKRAEVLADLGVDVIDRNGCYETTDFWSPQQLERFLGARLRRELEVMHSGGAVVCYKLATGVVPILDFLADLDFDVYRGIEPVLGDMDMELVARKLCDRHAFWDGVSGPMHIGEGTPEIARQAVRDAFRLFGPRGLILGTVASIRPHWPWENVLAMLDEWRRLREWSLP